jgi:hypothetical protein
MEAEYKQNILQAGFKFHHIPYITKRIEISPIHYILYITKRIPFPPIDTSSGITKRFNKNQACFFFLDFCIWIFSLLSLHKYGVLLVPKSWGLYEVPKDEILSNWLYSSSSTTFSIPTILFFQA